MYTYVFTYVYFYSSTYLCMDMNICNILFGRQHVFDNVGKLCRRKTTTTRAIVVSTTATNTIATAISTSRRNYICLYSCN